MFNYPELVRLSAILCISILIFVVALWRKKSILAQYSAYFVLVALFELLNISAFYFGDDPFTPLKYILFVLLLWSSKSFKELENPPFSSRSYFSIVIAACLSYNMFKFIFCPSFFEQMEFPVVSALLIFGLIILSLPILLVWFINECIDSKYKITEMFSFINFILTPLTVVIFVFVLDISGVMNHVKFGEVSIPKIINGIKVDIGDSYYNSKNNLNQYLEINAGEGKSIQWHNMPVKTLSRIKIVERYNPNNANDVIDYTYDYLKVYVENDQIIHHRLCDKQEPLKFRFLSDNYDDWSEENTEFVHCQLVANSALNKMRILENLGEYIFLTYKPLQNSSYHPKVLYQDLTLLPYIKWRWEVNKKVELFPGVNSEITDLYLDDHRNLMALIIRNQIENSDIKQIKLNDQCSLSRSEFFKMVVLDVGANAVLATFPNLDYHQRCTPQQLELRIKKKFIFDY